MATQSLPSQSNALVYGCCRTEQSEKRHLIENEWSLPPIPLALGSLSSREMDLQSSPKAILDHLMSTIRQEFEILRRYQERADGMLKDRMLTMDEKLNELLHNHAQPAAITMQSAAGTKLDGVNGMEEDSRPLHVSWNTQIRTSSATTASSTNSKKQGKVRCASKIQRQSDLEAEQARKTNLQKQYTLHTRSFDQKSNEESQGCSCARVVLQPWFDPMISVMVVLNALLIGLIVNHEAVSNEKFAPYLYAEYFFIGVFTVELFLRMAGGCRSFCKNSGRGWACFDVVLVLVSWIDLSLMILSDDDGLPGPGASAAKILKLARMVRITRVLRMTKLLAKVRVMGTIIVNSMASLFWLFLLISALLYIFAVLLTQGATEWSKEFQATQVQKHLEIQDMFGTVPKSMLTLFQSVTSGVNWGEPNGLAQALGYMYGLIFMFFIFFFVFSVLNIVTGVYVDGAIQQANADRAMQEMKHLSEKQLYFGLLMDTLVNIDADGDGFITPEEWKSAMKNKQVQSLMNMLEIDSSDAVSLFSLLNDDGDDVVSIAEFVEGMEKLKGHAKSIHVHQVLHRLNQLIDLINSHQQSSYYIASPVSEVLPTPIEPSSSNPT